MAVTLSDLILDDRIREVQHDEKFDPTELRLSETGACPRLRVLKMLGYKAEPHSEEEARYFERGHIAEAWVVAQYRRKYPRRTRCQVTVRPRGIPATGHIDLWVPPEKKIIEVKSVSKSVFDRDIPREEHIMQVQAYLECFRDAEGKHRTDDAELVYVCMDTLRTRAFPVKRDVWTGVHIISELDKLMDKALARELPPVEGFPDEPPCTIRMDSGPRKCPMWKHCHSEESMGWGMSFAITSNEGLAATAAEYIRLKTSLDEAKRRFEQGLKPLEDELAEVRRRLEERMDALGTEACECGDYVVRRTVVPARITYDVEAAWQAGILPSNVRGLLAKYARETKPYTRLSVSKKKGEGTRDQ